MVARIVEVDSFDLVVFGGTGDLSRRKLLPALYHRDRAGQVPDAARIIAVARSDLTTTAYREEADIALREFLDKDDLDPICVERFLKRLHYARVDVLKDDHWGELTRLLDGRRECIRAFYLAVSPSFFASICEGLGREGLITGQSRVVVEKPLGTDLASATDLHDRIGTVFPEDCVYRIDHYLGKETVQNLMALRFANALLEPLWNARHIDHVQITVAESVGVEGRGSYYDHAGAMRDMVQNHMLQLLCLTAMEPPARFEANDVRDEKVKVLRSLEPITLANVGGLTVRGQYRDREGHPLYLQDAGVERSNTETFIALKAEIGNWRWSGTPFYLRTGKRLRARMSEIVVVFKDAPHSIFPQSAGKIRRNALVIRLQPQEGVTLDMNIKEPGPGGMRLRDAALDMTFAETMGDDKLRMPDAYERLLMDVIRGDQTLFMRRDEVEAAWGWVDPIISAWAQMGDAPFPYDSGSSGPDEALRMMHRDDRSWREIRV